MRRFALEKPLIDRRMKLARQYVGKDWKYAKAGYVRKKHPLDCGHTRCGICNSNKQHGHQETRQEAVARIRMTEATA